MPSAEVWKAIAEYAGAIGVGLVVLCVLVSYFAGIIETIFSKLKFEKLSGDHGFRLARLALYLGFVLIGVAIVAVVISFFAPPKERNVKVQLRHDGKTVTQPYKIRCLIPGRNSTVEEAKDGVVELLGLPSRLTSLNIDWISYPGFDIKPPGGPFPIRNQLAIVDVVASGPKEPWGLSDFPNVEPYLPTTEQRMKAPDENPKSVVFTMENDSGDDLMLVMYNCSEHGNENPDASKMRSRWITRELPSDGIKRTMEQFSGNTNGCYIFFLADKDRKCIYATTENIFQRRYPVLHIDKWDKSNGKFPVSINYD